ncbi:sporulation protein YqfD [Zhaonella formicivorans]|uniref:sporulation protein YqfD n=1 Tax=Zhaonella formicivorans TaxID=2528593 RepID=UPI0010D55EC0|nr:sporulation protein YqfD [Zhaonella formicivorans]
MLFKRLWSYFLGYCVIMVEGPRKERFINLAATRGIDLWDIAHEGDSRLWGKVAVNGIKPLRHIARLSRCRYKIMAKNGLPFVLSRAEKRKGLVVGALLFSIALYWLSSYVWFVEVRFAKPMETLSKEEILTEAARAGLKPGVLKSSLDLAKLEKELVLRLPAITFISIELQGTLARIEVVEKKVIKDDKDRRPAHIVATKDGVIEEILVLLGEPRVAEGDTVQEGQVLISGIVPPRAPADNPAANPGEVLPINQAPQIVRARGIVRARVWYEKIAQAAVVETGENPTGRKVRQLSLKVGDKQIVLKGPKEAPYRLYDTEIVSRNINNWRILKQPVEVIQATYYEMEFYRHELGTEGALRKAKETAIAALNREIPQHARVLDQKVELLKAEQGMVKVRVWVETLEEIGIAQEFPAAD